MQDADIRRLAAEVLAVIAPEADLGSVRDDEDLREALDLDSMDFMNFIVGLHEGSGRTIPAGDVPRLYTLRGLVGYFA